MKFFLVKKKVRSGGMITGIVEIECFLYGMESLLCNEALLVEVVGELSELST